MLRSIFFAAMVTLPAIVLAEDVDPTIEWRDCAVDSDCIALQGTCNLTAVNVGYKDDAVDYYKKLRADASCVKRFWAPEKNLVPECKPLAGSEPDRQGDGTHPTANHQYSAVMNHGKCVMVPNPTPDK